MKDNLTFDRVVNERWSIYINENNEEVFVEDNRGKLAKSEGYKAFEWSRHLTGGMCSIK